MSRLRNRQKEVIKKLPKNTSMQTISLNQSVSHKLNEIRKNTNMNVADIIEIAIRRLYEYESNNFLSARNNATKD